MIPLSARVLCKNHIANKLNFVTNHFKTCAVREFLWERNDKGGYVDRRTKPSHTQLIRDGFKELKYEIALWKQEMKEKFENDPLYVYRPGETDIVWSFGHKESLDKWLTTCDADHNEGYSSCSLTLNKHGKGVFSGNLVTKVPKDGKIKRAGYCNMKTLRARVRTVKCFIASLLNWLCCRNRLREKHI